MAARRPGRVRASTTIAARVSHAQEAPMDNDTPPPSQRYAPPAAEVADVSASGQTQLAGRGARLAGAIIDGVILLGLWWVVGLVTPWNIFSPKLAQAGVFALFGLQLLGLLLFAIVNGYLLMSRGQTVGKLLLGMRITRQDGSAAAPGRVIGLRYGVGWLISAVPVVGMVYALVDCLLIFRADRRCLHDLIADTIVVKV
jgi:uncharacterized RDD family membrane protein YckC